MIKVVESLIINWVEQIKIIVIGGQIAIEHIVREHKTSIVGVGIIIGECKTWVIEP